MERAIGNIAPRSEMTRRWAVLILACCGAISAQGVDSVLLSDRIRAVGADRQGNILTAEQVGAEVAVVRYSPGGQLVESFEGPGQTLPAGATPIVACDSRGAIYLASGRAAVRPSAPWTPQFPATDFEIAAITFDPQDNPIFAVADRSALPITYTRLIKLDRDTGRTLANLQVAQGIGPTAVTADANGAVYVVGMADSPSGIEGFAGKLDAGLTSVLYFRYLDPAMPHAIAVDAAGNAYVAETPFGVPVTVGPPSGGAIIHFGANAVYKIDPSGATVASNSGGGSSIAITPDGSLIVAGGSYPPDGAFRAGCGPRADLGGLPVTLLDAATLRPRQSAFLAQQQLQGAPALLPDGTLYLATQSGRVLHISPANGSSPVSCIVNGASFQVENSIVPGELLTVFGAGLGTDPLIAYDDSQQLPFSSNGTEVRIGGFPAALLAVSSSQINAIVPYELPELNPSRPLAIEILRNGSVIYTWHLNPGIRNPTPLLRFDVSGALTFFQAARFQDVFSTYPVPLADVWNADGTRNSAANPAHLGQTITIFATGMGELGGSNPKDGAPGGSVPQWPANLGSAFPDETVAEISVATPYGYLGSLPNYPKIATVPGRTNAVLQVVTIIPTNIPPGPLPFVLQSTAAANPVWSNFFYVAP